MYFVHRFNEGKDKKIPLAVWLYRKYWKESRMHSKKSFLYFDCFGKDIEKGKEIQIGRIFKHSCLTW